MTQQDDDPVDTLDADYVKLVRGVAQYLRDLQGRANATIVDISRNFVERDPSPAERSLLARAYRSRDHVVHLVDCLCEHEAVTVPVLDNLMQTYPGLFSRIRRDREEPTKPK